MENEMSLRKGYIQNIGVALAITGVAAPGNGVATTVTFSPRRPKADYAVFAEENTVGAKVVITAKTVESFTFTDNNGGTPFTVDFLVL
jgi:hypothetical protein